METIELTVDGMSCEHCEKAVKCGVGMLSGVQSVSVNLAQRIVTVEYDPKVCPLHKIKNEIDELGYEIIENY